VGEVDGGVHPRTLEIVPVTVPRRDDAIPITPPAGSYADEYCLISYTRKPIHNAYPTPNTVRGTTPTNHVQETGVQGGDGGWSMWYLHYQTSSLAINTSQSLLSFFRRFKSPCGKCSLQYIR
jgi:hypothetical protein